jgi:hypothetical protein
MPPQPVRLCGGPRPSGPVSTMPDGHENNALRDLLEHERARRFAARRVREQLAAIAAQAPGYLITTEHYPGRRERFVAKATSPVAHPNLVMTDDLDELFVELLGRPGSAQIISFTAPTAKGGDDEAS